MSSPSTSVSSSETGTYVYQRSHESEFFEEIDDLSRTFKEFRKDVYTIKNPCLSAIDSAHPVRKYAAYFFVLPVAFAWFLDSFIVTPDHNKLDEKFNTQENDIFATIAADMSRESSYETSGSKNSMNQLAKEGFVQALNNNEVKLTLTPEEEAQRENAIEMFMTGNGEKNNESLRQAYDKVESAYKDYLQGTVIPGLYKKILPEFQGDKLLALEFLNFFHQGTFILSQLFIQKALIGDDVGNPEAPQLSDDQQVLASYRTDVGQKTVTAQKRFTLGIPGAEEKDLSYLHVAVHIDFEKKEVREEFRVELSEADRNLDAKKRYDEAFASLHRDQERERLQERTPPAWVQSKAYGG